jgi:hypothetical protein
VITACAGTCSRFLYGRTNKRGALASNRAEGHEAVHHLRSDRSVNRRVFLLILGAPAGYWDGVNVIQKLFKVMLVTVPYNYLFGFIPALMIGAVDDILLHIRMIGPFLRMALTGLVAFAATAILYGTLGSETGFQHYLLYGLVGFIPATFSSWLAHKFDKPTAINPGAVRA